MNCNYFGFKSSSSQVECGQNNKCVVNTDRILVALDSYLTKLQQLSTKHDEKDSKIGYVSTTVYASPAKTRIEEVCPLNSCSDSASNADGSCEKCSVIIAGSEQCAEKNESVDRIRHEEIFESSKDVSAVLVESRTRCYSARNVSDDRPYKCTDCEKAFKRNLHLKRHFVVSHTQKKNFSCTVCGKSFSRKDYLDKHMGTHQRKNFKLKLLQQGIVVRTKMRVKTTTQN